MEGRGRGDTRRGGVAARSGHANPCDRQLDERQNHRSRQRTTGEPGVRPAECWHRGRRLGWLRRHQRSPRPWGDDQTKASETSPPMQAIAPGSAAAAAVAQEYVGEWALRNAWLYNGYVKTPKSGQYLFNVEAATKDLVLEDSGNTASAVLATTSKKDFAAVEADESRRLHLLVVDLVLVLALALAATAQLAKQRRALGAARRDECNPLLWSDNCHDIDRGWMNGGLARHS